MQIMTTAKIKYVELLNEDNVEEREVLVTLTNGTKIHIVRCYESWEQWGGNEDELYLTVPIADEHNAWLHGQGTSCRSQRASNVKNVNSLVFLNYSI